MPFRKHDPRIGFIVSKQDVEARLHLLDVIRLEKQRLRFRARRDDLHRTRQADHAAQALRELVQTQVGRNALLEAEGLAT
ncbi:hypothetical protein [Asaia platycodi]|uniref:hypothetical protein n=1 Tax=Asaia platycodi TaxID=610243 RepID=UPI00046E7205